jgi:hypothetical protein
LKTLGEKLALPSMSLLCKSNVLNDDNSEGFATTSCEKPVILSPLNP